MKIVSSDRCNKFVEKDLIPRKKFLKAFSAEPISAEHK